MLEALQQYEFLRNALAAILLGSISCGIVGTLVVVNRLSALAGGVAHACFGGLGLSYLLGAPPTAGALAFGLASALGIGAASSRWREAADAAIAAIWAGGMALGLVFIQLAPGYAPDLMSYSSGAYSRFPPVTSCFSPQWTQEYSCSSSCSTGPSSRCPSIRSSGGLAASGPIRSSWRSSAS